MTYKPIKLRDYLRWIRRFGWSLHKGKIDWNLRDERNIYVCSIIVKHPGAREVVTQSVQKTERELRARGLI
jgi:hypothetical protein